ncbi:hypothetical protein PDN46_27895 [Bacillus cereus group sp. Bc191]|nr:hypothetical protein [Bacillus cereus group sp. Bc191]MDA2292085.1 hypothetical protein [Bacillus cereus group sp. Bc191]
MNMHQKQELSLFAEELYRYMSPATLNQLAIEGVPSGKCGFTTLSLFS